MESEKGTLGKGTLGKGSLGASSQVIPLLAFLSFTTPLVFTLAEMSGSATPNSTVAAQCDVHPLTTTLLHALSDSNPHAALESCTFIRDAAYAGKVSGVFFHTDLVTGGFDFVPPSYRESQHLQIKDHERLAFEEEKEAFQSLKAAWIEELASQSAAPTAAQARKLWLVKYQPQLSLGTQKTVQKIAKIWVKSSQSGLNAKREHVTKL